MKPIKNMTPAELRENSWTLATAMVGNPVAERFAEALDALAAEREEVERLRKELAMQTMPETEIADSGKCRQCESEGV